MAQRRTPSRGTRPGASRGGRDGVRRPGHARPAQRGTVRGRPSPRPARPRFTNRMAVLVVVAAVLMVSYASSMRAWLEQRSQIATLRADIASSQTDIAALEREKRRWEDDAYVEAQARERFSWVLPGETLYQVIDRDGQPLEGNDELTDPGDAAREVPRPWWEKVEDSLRAADHPEDVPVPATRITPPPAPTPSPDE